MWCLSRAPFQDYQAVGPSQAVLAASGMCALQRYCSCPAAVALFSFVWTRVCAVKSVFTAIFFPHWKSLLQMCLGEDANALQKLGEVSHGDTVKLH